MYSRLIIAAILLGALAGCGEGGEATVPRLPNYFRLSATASATEGQWAVDCSLEFIAEISGEVSRTPEVIEYIATMGGEAQRNFQRSDGYGVSFWGDAYYGQMQVLHILPNRVQLISEFYSPDGPDSGSSFWEELTFFEGFIDANGVIKGEWLCAPMNSDYGGVDDFSIYADGTWQTEEIVNVRR